MRGVLALLFLILSCLASEAGTLVGVVYDVKTLAVLMIVKPDEDGELLAEVFHKPGTEMLVMDARGYSSITNSKNFVEAVMQDARRKLAQRSAK